MVREKKMRFLGNDAWLKSAYQSGEVLAPDHLGAMAGFIAMLHSDHCQDNRQQHGDANQQTHTK